MGLFDINICGGHLIGIHIMTLNSKPIHPFVIDMTFDFNQINSIPNSIEFWAKLHVFCPIELLGPLTVGAINKL